MTITAYDSKFADISTAYKEVFSELFLSDAPGASSAHESYTMMDSCEGSSYEYDFLSNDPVMREWVGLKIVEPLRANSHRITVKSYQKSTSIPLPQLRGDSSGIIANRLAKWLQSRKRDLDKLAFNELVVNGFANNGFDGVPLFSTAHPNGPSGATQSNLGTTALSLAQFKVVNAAMQAFRDENGEPLNVSPDTLIVGPSNADLAMQITGNNRAWSIAGTSGAEVAVGGTAVATTAVPNTITANPYGQTIKVVIDPRLIGTYAAYWFLVDSTKGKPVIVAEQGAPEATDNLANWKDIPNAKFSVEYFAAIGLGHWATVYGNQV